ncbi:hypothetical protein J7T55_008714 [Diaporthe amygdali]|uniref:uncharacterized protein n=1 Tax=Phomopsis amygdali TaxID=1214568 RepID=UPI0022FDB3B5|nr:uncharacterized protein J7T55_008714 [Diaporthe amygdali]KAJ0121550.1 hypothetical protein J7T55_008714 [Diaporthe amygdali]
MFCTSLRRRKEWAPVVPRLLQNRNPKFREGKLDTHDVNLPLPSPGAPGTRYLRFVLLSSADQDSTARRQRIERLENQSGGSDAAVVWLMGEGGDQSSYLQFQIELVDSFEIPLLPLRSVEDLPDALHRFHRAFLQANASRPDSALSAVQKLLPYSGLSPPLREHTTNLLTDLTMGFAHLANKAVAENGQLELAEYLGKEEARRVILFWTQEYLL